MMMEAIQIFMNDMVISLSPKPPIFFLKVTKRSKVTTIAAILAARASPPMPRYLDNTKLKTMLITTAMVALIMGVFVSCKA